MLHLLKLVDSQSVEKLTGIATPSETCCWAATIIECAKTQCDVAHTGCTFVAFNDTAVDDLGQEGVGVTTQSGLFVLLHGGYGYWLMLQKQNSSNWPLTS